MLSNWSKTLVVALLALFAVLSEPARMAVAQKDIAATVPVIPVGKENDVKFYAADGSVTMGKSALELMPKSGLVLWLAGNQFFAMDEVVSAFQRKRPGTSV